MEVYKMAAMDEFVDEYPKQSIVAYPVGWNLQKAAGVIRILQNRAREPLAYPAFLFDPLTGKAYNAANPFPVSATINVTVSNITTLGSITNPVRVWVEKLPSTHFNGNVDISTATTSTIQTEPNPRHLTNICVQTVGATLAVGAEVDLTIKESAGGTVFIFEIFVPVAAVAYSQLIQINFPELGLLIPAGNLTVTCSAALLTGKFNVSAWGFA